MQVSGFSKGARLRATLLKILLLRIIRYISAHVVCRQAAHHFLGRECLALHGMSHLGEIMKQCGSLSAILFSVVLSSCGGGGSVPAPMMDETRSPLDQPFHLPMTGTATYIGEAAGTFSTRHGTDFPDYPVGSIANGEYQGNLRLIADFGERTISGDIRDVDLVNISVTYPENAITRDIPDVPSSGYEIQFGHADIHEQGHFIGSNMELTHPNLEFISTRGSWSGLLSNTRDGLPPRAVDGSHSGHSVLSGGSETSWLGTHHGIKERRVRTITTPALLPAPR